MFVTNNTKEYHYFHSVYILSWSKSLYYKHYFNWTLYSIVPVQICNILKNEKQLLKELTKFHGKNSRNWSDFDEAFLFDVSIC